MKNVIKVGMADLSASSHPSKLTTLGLGSCVGIALYDAKLKVIGMAHAMLPDSSQAKNTANIAKFVDSSIYALISEMEKQGGQKENIVAKLAGGAKMFAFKESADLMRIGQRNVIAAKEKLNQLKIPIISEDTGGNYGRTIILDSDTGMLYIKTIGYGVKEI
ncbi:chemotaxis protein CheD [Herbivorax sp. ANBcel31]|uniref:chemotaxis protein CheD n=1 Tax=Herbivorax sp. ANBcel31 TaxID=3069754 RepID=UPI0027AEC9C3|nr:chemotaxis protein CheD [Herbivorax sp. ANBcel31]MDQ2085869.1 chemotaxis protein CheD [Herbivorax sp. ANBcel31]